MTVRIQDLQAEGIRKDVHFRSGQTVRVHRKIKEGEKERIQMFEGMIIKTGGTGVGSTITVRKVIDGIGVEQVFPISSPLVEKIDLIKEAKVRRGRLYFMRGLQGKAARLKERFFTDEEIRAMKPHHPTDAELQEAVVHQEEEEKKKEESASS